MPKAQIITPRQVVEATCRELKEQAAEVDVKAALLDPKWQPDDGAGTEWVESARLGPYELMAMKTSAMLHSQAPEGAARISWSVTHEDEDDVLAYGEATTREEAKEFAYLIYQAAHGYHETSGRD